MNKHQMQQLSASLQDVAKKVGFLLKQSAGEPVGFVLMVAADYTVQYVSNCARKDGVMMIETQLEHWRTGRADIPGHINPDLKVQTADQAKVRDERLRRKVEAEFINIELTSDSLRPDKFAEWAVANRDSVLRALEATPWEVK